MLETAQRLAMLMGDALLGWTLDLPRAFSLLVVALLTAAILVGIRYFCSRQEQLRRIRQDLGRLRELRRQARRKADKSEIARLQTNQLRVRLLRLRLELLPLAVSLVPLGILATWSAQRLAYHPPRHGEPLRLIVRLPVSFVSDRIELVPASGLQSVGDTSPQVQVVRLRPARGEAGLCFIAHPPQTQWTLGLRIGQRTFSHPIFVGDRIYAPPLVEHPEIRMQSELSLREVRLFDLVPGLPQWGLPAWLIGYLLVATSMTFVLKRLLGID